jgi:hypothetical protein
VVDTASGQAAVGSCYDGDWAETPEAIHGVNSAVESRIGGAELVGVAVLIPAGRHFCLYISAFVEFRSIAKR